MKNYYVLFFLFITVSTFSQPNIQWQVALGGSASDEAYDVKQTPDGGYIVVGTTTSSNGHITSTHGGNDLWVVKLNTQGNLQWQKTYGGTLSDGAYAVEINPNGGYYVAGHSRSNDGDASGNHGAIDFWVLKLDALGVVIWQKSLGGSGTDVARAICVSPDGGVVVAGGSNSINGDISGAHGGGYFDAWVVKLDASGNLVWQNPLGGSNSEEAFSVISTSDGGYMVAGYTSSNNGNVSGFKGTNDYWVVKLNSNGILQWQKCLGGTKGDSARDIIQTLDGGYLVVGESQSNDGDVTGHFGASNTPDYWAVKIDASGNIIWEKSYGGTNYDYARAVCQTTDGNFGIVGTTDSSNGQVSSYFGTQDYWMVLIDGTGSVIWDKSLGGTNMDNAYSVIQTQDEGFVVIGTSSSTNGHVTGNNGGVDYWVVKLDNSSLSVNDYNFNSTVTLYPNPVNTKLHINSTDVIKNIGLYTLSGQLVFSHQNENLEYINVSNLPKGVYILTLENEEGQKLNKKIIKK